MTEAARARLAGMGLLAVPFAAAWIFAPRLTLEQFDLPKDTALAILVGVWLAMTGGATLRSAIRWSPAMGVLVATAMMAAAAAPGWSAAWLGDRENLTGVITFLMWGILFAAGATLAAARMRRIAMAVVVAATGSAVYGLAQQAGWDPFRGELFRHVRAAAGNPDFLAQQLAMALPLALASGPGAGSLGLGGVLLIVLALTGSRAGLAAGVAAAGWLLFRRRSAHAGSGPRLRIAAGVAAAAIIAAEVMIAPEISLRARIGTLASGQGLLSSRGAVWQGAAAAATARPLTGWGPDQLGSVFLAYAPPGWASREGLGETARNAHCEPLHLLVSLGVAGLGAWLWLLAATWRRWRSRPAYGGTQGRDTSLLDDAVAAALLACLMHNLFSFSSATTAPVFWLLLGWLNRGRPDPGTGQPPVRGHIWLPVAAGLAVFATVRFAADACAYRGNEAGRAGQVGASAAGFATAARLAPWDPGYLIRWAYALEQLGHPAEALPRYERAAVMKPADGLALGHVGRVRYGLAVGAKDAPDQRAALDLMVRSIDLAPSQPSLYGPALNAAQSFSEIGLRDRLLAQLAARDPEWYAKMVRGH